MRTVRDDSAVDAVVRGPADGPNQLRTPPWAWALLALLTITTLAARFVGIDRLLPHAPEADAVIVWQASWLDRPVGEEMGWHSAPATYYPFLLARIVDAAPGRSHIVPAHAAAPLEEHLEAAARPYRKARSVLAVLSVVLVVATFLVARRFFAPGWSLCAAAFVATSLLDTAYAQQARPHAASASMSLLAVLAALRLYERPSVPRYLLAGFASAVAVGTLHTGVFTLVALFTAHALVRGRRWWPLGVALALVVLSLWAFYPWLFALGIFAPGGGGRLDIGGQELGPEHFTGAGFEKIVRGIFGHDPVLLVLAGAGAAIGVGCWLRSSQRPHGELRAKLLVLLGFPVAFTIFFGSMSRVEPRFVISLVPYLALLAVLALHFFAQQLQWGATARVAMSLVVLAFPTFVCGKSLWLGSRPDTYMLAAQWIETHADRDKDRIAINFLCTLPLLQRRAGITDLPQHALNEWEHYQLMLDPAWNAAGWSTALMFKGGMFLDRTLSAEEAMSVVRDERSTYAVVLEPFNERTASDQTRAGVARNGTLVARFAPADSTLVLSGGGIELGWRTFEVVLNSERLGPPIEIYRMK